MPQLHTTNQAAKLLGIGQKKLLKKLRDAHVFNTSNLPYQTYIDRGYFTVHQSRWLHPECGIQYSASARVTNKGVEWLQQFIKQQENAA